MNEVPFGPEMLAAPKEARRRAASHVAAVDPRDGGVWEVLLTHQRMDVVAARGRGAALELARTVPFALLHPRAVFQGVRDEGEREWLCYAAVPDVAYDWPTGNQRPPWPGEVFLVFVSFPERVIYHHNWVRASRDNPGLPEDHEKRFDRRIL